MFRRIQFLLVAVLVVSISTPFTGFAAQNIPPELTKEGFSPIILRIATLGIM